jgi:ankyrin repeat protein
MKLGIVMNPKNFRLSAFCLTAVILLAWSIPAFCGEIHDAVQTRDLAKVRALLKANPEMVSGRDVLGYTPLHYAVSKEMVALLYKADVNSKSSNSITPLHAVVMDCPKDVVELLLTNKADVNARDMNGSTPLHEAAQIGRKDIVELLLSHGAEVNPKDDGGTTPLQAAARRHHKDIVELLRRHGGHE